MKKLMIVSAMVALAGSMLAAETTLKAEASRPKKVLMIGNSFSICVLNEMPKVCADMGLKLDLCSMFIGGCSLETHMNNVRNKPPKPYLVTWHYDSVTNQAAVPFASALGDFHGEKNHSNICDMLVADTWDVVTVQQASHDSTALHTYHPWGDDLVATIRKLAPQAEIVVQETWSYTPWDGRLAGWKIDQDEMYRRLHDAYYAFAGQYGLRVIPTGLAVQKYRHQLPVKYTENSLGDDVAGSLTFAKDEATGKWNWKGDSFHLNAKGHFLQALVWTGKLFGVDPAKGTSCPLRSRTVPTTRASCAVSRPRR